MDISDGNSDGGQSLEDQDELHTPDDIEGPCADGEKDEETLRAIR